MNASSAEQLAPDTELQLLVIGDVFVAIWRREPSVSGAQTLGREYSSFAASRPLGTALLLIIEERVPMPAPAPFEAIARSLSDTSAAIVAVAVVFDGDGDRAAAVRSMALGLTRAASARFPRGVFASLREATIWLERESGGELAVPVSAFGLELGVSDLRTAG